jgi:small subunit ribosomal protein S16
MLRGRRLKRKDGNVDEEGLFLYSRHVMLKLRLTRIGRKHDPSFRVVVTENTSPARGKYLESVGFYNANLKQVQLNTERIKHWLGFGVQPTDVVHNLLIKEGVIDGKKIAVHSRKPKKKVQGSADKATGPSAGGEAPQEAVEEGAEQPPVEEATETPTKTPAEQPEAAEEEAKEAPAEEPAAEEPEKEKEEEADTEPETAEEEKKEA